MAANIEEVKVGGATEVESATPAAAPVKPAKKERTPNQIAQFEAARKKAYEMRSQAKEALKNQKAAATAQEEEAQVEVVETSEEEAPPPPKAKKVKKRKVVVVEAEESDTEEEMEIRLPPKKEKPAPPPDPYAAHYSRMFSL